jgi:hypothetical protein
VPVQIDVLPLAKVRKHSDRTPGGQRWDNDRLGAAFRHVSTEHDSRTLRAP